MNQLQYEKLNKNCSIHFINNTSIYFLRTNDRRHCKTYSCYGKGITVNATNGQFYK